MLCSQGFSFPACKAVAGATPASTTKVYWQCWKEWPGFVLEKVNKNAICATKLTYFAFLSLVVSIIGIYFVVLAFWNIIIITSLQMILSSLKVVYHLYFHYPPTHKHFEPWDVEHYFLVRQLGYSLIPN